MGTSDQPGGVPLSLGHSTFIPNEDEPRSRFRLGFVLGLLVGVLATLLLVPKTGEETREQVKEITTVLRERAVGMMTGERPYDPNADDPETAGL
ncbi:MAG: YtxH domain-containing protein [Thermomicrobiales bacterium]